MGAAGFQGGGTLFWFFSLRQLVSLCRSTEQHHQHGEMHSKHGSAEDRIIGGIAPVCPVLPSACLLVYAHKDSSDVALTDALGD